MWPYLKVRDATDVDPKLKHDTHRIELRDLFIREVLFVGCHKTQDQAVPPNPSGATYNPSFRGHGGFLNGPLSSKPLTPSDVLQRFGATVGKRTCQAEPTHLCLM